MNLLNLLQILSGYKYSNGWTVFDPGDGETHIHVKCETCHRTVAVVYDSEDEHHLSDLCMSSNSNFCLACTGEGDIKVTDDIWVRFNNRGVGIYCNGGQDKVHTCVALIGSNSVDNVYDDLSTRSVLYNTRNTIHKFIDDITTGINNGYDENHESVEVQPLCVRDIIWAHASVLQAWVENDYSLDLIDWTVVSAMIGKMANWEVIKPALIRKLSMLIGDRDPISEFMRLFGEQVLLALTEMQHYCPDVVKYIERVDYDLPYEFVVLKYLHSLGKNEEVHKALDKYINKHR